MNAENLLLAGDVGGTKTLLCLFDENNGSPVEVRTSKYVSGDFENLEAIVHDLLQEYHGVPKAAAFGIPGPVEDGVVKATNLPWTIEEKLLIKHTGIAKVKLLNDLEATAHAITSLTSDEVVNLKKGTTHKSPERYVVLAPGTGLGESFLIHKNGKKIVIPSEGGHTDFAPTSKIESELFGFLHQKFGHVSHERIISGIGIPNIFDFFVEILEERPEKETLQKMKTNDRAVVITEMALAKKDDLCAKTLDLFVSILGTHAGNLALTFLPDGGIYLAGGIPFKILPKLKDCVFVNSFLNKGRLKEVVDQIPINVITNNNAAIKGAALVAYEISPK